MILEYLLSTNSFSDLNAFLKEYSYNKTGLLGQYGFKRKKVISTKKILSISQQKKKRQQ
ncbi:DNA polymerase III PolC-type [Streptococcus pneumoniae GA04175]|nr:DNA polymerase III PolC-type [Streptococcus pneumoniae GA04175]